MWPHQQSTPVDLFENLIGNRIVWPHLKFTVKQNFIILNILVSETSEEAVENIANGLFVTFYIKFKIIIFK